MAELLSYFAHLPHSHLCTVPAGVPLEYGLLACASPHALRNDARSADGDEESVLPRADVRAATATLRLAGVVWAWQMGRQGQQAGTAVSRSSSSSLHHRRISSRCCIHLLSPPPDRSTTSSRHCIVDAFAPLLLTSHLTPALTVPAPISPACSPCSVGRRGAHEVKHNQLLPYSLIGAWSICSPVPA